MRQTPAITRSMFQSVPFIADDGTMHLHTREGGVATFEFETDTGVPRDMSAAQIWFETKGATTNNFRKKMTVGDQTSQLVLTVQVGDLNHLLNKPTGYVILDETGTVPHILFSGTVAITGFEA